MPHGFPSTLWIVFADEASRENYEKYGHPDGRQGLDLGIALPEWMFMQDNRSAPIMLLALVFGGILLPLGAAACYIFRSNKFMGPNNVMQETIEIFLRYVRWRDLRVLLALEECRKYALQGSVRAKILVWFCY